MADYKIPENCPLAGVEISTVVNSKTTEQIHRVETELSLLKRDITIFDKYFAKIDLTVTKLGEVIEQIHRLVSVHDERIEGYRQDSNELKALVEERRLETVKAIGDLEEKISSQGEKITEGFDTFKKDVLTGIDQTNTRIKKLELWRSLIIGGAIVIGFLITTLFSTTVQRVINPNSQTTVIQTPVK